MKTKHYAGLAKQAKDIQKRVKESELAAKRSSTKKTADFKKSLWYSRLANKNK